MTPDNAKVIFGFVPEVEAADRAPTVAENVAAATTHPSVWDFFNNFWGSLEFQIIAMIVLFGIVGVVANYIVKWSRGQIEGHLWKYLFVDNLKTTVAAYITYLTTMVGIMMAGTFQGDDETFIGWKAVIIMCFTTAFGFDAAINKGQRPKWKPAQREQAIATAKAKGNKITGGVAPDAVVVPKTKLKRSSR